VADSIQLRLISAPVVITVADDPGDRDVMVRIMCVDDDDLR
jgi:hypothetical protein